MRRSWCPTSSRRCNLCSRHPGKTPSAWMGFAVSDASNSGIAWIAAKCASLRCSRRLLERSRDIRQHPIAFRKMPFDSLVVVRIVGSIVGIAWVVWNRRILRGLILDPLPIGLGFRNVPFVLSHAAILHRVNTEMANLLHLRLDAVLVREVKTQFRNIVR